MLTDLRTRARFYAFMCGVLRKSSEQKDLSGG
jgi:hypothetical protein